MKQFWFALITLTLPLAGLAELTNKVLIIGIDGTMPQYLLQAQTPNLDLLRSNGCYSYRAMTHPVTHSAACWTAMFTGVWGDKNGVNDPNNVDVCATVLTHMGVAIDPAWNLDARLEGLPLPPAGYGTNLVFNGDAEFTSSTNNYYILDENQKIDRGIAWWFDGGMITLGQYGSHTRFPPIAALDATNRGNNFFLGGIGTSNVISQTIDVSHLGADIDDPGVDYVLSGLFGGAGTNNARFTFTVRFLNGSQAGLATNVIGPVTATDRTNSTTLLERNASAQVPPGTRAIQFVLTARSSTQTNDASADNLSFVLTPRVDPPLETAIKRPDSAGIQVNFLSLTNRFYLLERTTDFQSWTNASDEIAGTGSTISLTNSNPPSGQGFYRVRSRKN